MATRQYAIEFGAKDAHGEYNCMAEAGVFDTFAEAYNFMREHQGKPLRLLLTSDMAELMGEFDPDYDAVVEGATIEEFSDEYGREAARDYNAHGVMTGKY